MLALAKDCIVVILVTDDPVRIRNAFVIIK